MYFAVILPIISALSGVAFAQSIDPDSVPIAIRTEWCTDQITSCPLLCLQFPGNKATTTSNNCNAQTLDYSCVCWNGQSPNASQYSQTIPFFECTQSNNDCVANCGQDNTCSNNCRANNPCGAQSPTRVNTSTITSHSKTATGGSGSAATGSGSGSTSAFQTLGGGSSQATGNAGSGSNASGKSGAGALALDMGRSYGLAFVLAGVFAGFAIVL